MSGGLLQLVAYGAQDVYLTGNPQITFFKVVYRRHTNFAVEGIEQPFQGTADFARKVYVPILRNGDLVTKMYLKVTLPAVDVSATPGALFAWGRRVGLSLIDNVTLNIGGQRIDRQYGNWMNVWYEVTRNVGQDRGYAKLVGDSQEFTDLSATKPQLQLFVPLQLFHCRNDGLALPLIALQYHEVRVDFEFNPLAQCVCFNAAVTSLSSLNLELQNSVLLVNYVYLDSEERKRFAQASHEYLIEQLQHTGQESIVNTQGKYRLNFNHPCKALYWAVKFGRYTSGQQFLAWSPRDAASLQDIATKRFVYATAAVYAAANAICTVSATDSRVVGSQSVAGNATLANVFAAINPQVVGGISQATPIGQVSIAGAFFATAAAISSNCQVTNAYVNDITYENPLPWSYVSMPVSSMFSSVVRSTLTTPAATNQYMGVDVTVMDPFNYGLYLNRHGNPIQTGVLQLNGQDRFSSQPGSYFNYVTTWEVHSSTPSDGVNCYPFGLHPEDLQPSGTCNMSRIDNAQLNVTFGNPDDQANFVANYLALSSVIEIYTVNYNILRIMAGMGDLHIRIKSDDQTRLQIFYIFYKITNIKIKIRVGNDMI